MLGVEPERVLVDQVGLNHLTWIRAVHVDGSDVLPLLLAAHGDELAEQSALPRTLLEELGAIPSYYLHYFYAHDRVLAEQQHETPRAEVVAGIERELLEMYRDPELAEKPALLEQRGGAFYSEAAVGLVSSLVSGDGAVHEVDMRNGGTLAGLADDDVVEVPARVDRGRRRAAAAGAARAGAARARAARRRLRAARGARRRRRGIWRSRARRCSRTR